MIEERLIKLDELSSQPSLNLGKNKLISLSAANPAQEIHKCSWQMFVDLGIFTENDTKAALVERNLGYGSAMTSLHSNRGYLASGLDLEIKRPIKTIFEAIFEFNEYYHRVTNPYPIKEITYGLVDGITSPSSLNSEVIDDVLARGARLVYDRNDSLLAHLTPDHALDSTLRLNNKAHFHRLLEESSLEAPKTQILKLSSEDLNYLLEDEALTKERFIQILAEAHANFDLNINYFLKVSIGAGGIGLIRSESSNEDFVGMLKFYRGTKERNSEVELLVAEPLKVVSLPEMDPLDPMNTLAFSPCMTMAFTESNYILRQAAEQVLKGGTAYIGSMWDIQMQENLMTVLGSRFDTFAELIKSTHYTGLLGTDFIMTQLAGGPKSLSEADIRLLNRLNGEDKTQALRSMFDYTLIGDLNARQNGNCVGEKVKTSLHLSGFEVSKTFQSKKILEATPDTALEALNQNFRSMQLANIAGQVSGVVVLPDITSDFATSLQVTTVFINPQLRPSEFQKFLEI